MDQPPRFSNHVIRGLTAKFNHHREKLHHSDMSFLANLHVQMILNVEEERLNVSDSS